MLIAFKEIVPVHYPYLHVHTLIIDFIQLLSFITVFIINIQCYIILVLVKITLLN